MQERVQKIISASGLMSRRAAEACILAGRVQVNGETAALGDRADPQQDQILVDGRELPAAGKKLYLALNKPRGYVTTMRDEKGRKNVSDLVENLGERVYPVGRLDMDSEGLLIMTNDGEFANRLMHPSHEVRKIYRTWVQGDDIGQRVELLRQPMEIDGYRIQPAEVELERIAGDRATLLICIHEGRNRQIRRMCEQAGLRVTRLCRIQEGPVRLEKLATGKWRHLTEDELCLLQEE